MATTSSNISALAEMGPARENLVMAYNVAARDSQEATDGKKCSKMEVASENNYLGAVHLLSEPCPEPITNKTIIDSTEDSSARTESANLFKGTRLVNEEAPAQSMVIAGLDSSVSTDHL